MSRSRLAALGAVLVCAVSLLLLCVIALSGPSSARAASAGPNGARPSFGITTTTTATTSTPTAPEPPNNDRDNAQPLGGVPASAIGTTVGSVLESHEPGGGCGALAGAVWYSVSFGAHPPTDEVGVRVQDGGQLDACIDVFTKVRSQSFPVTSANTDASGLGRLTFRPQANTIYLIRVGQLLDSDPGPFSIQLLDVSPGASAPGPQLPAAGGHGRLDAFFTTTASYSAKLTAAVTYKLNLVNPQGGCMQLGVYGPGTTSFTGPALSAGCSNYRLFTPTQSGRYSFLITAAGGLAQEQPFSLHVAAATNAEMAPGTPLDNLQTVRGRLRGNVDSVVRLYSVTVTTRSQLTLQLDTSADFGLELLQNDGRVIECECNSGGDQQVQAVTRPGTYYVAVRAQDFSSGGFTLTRQSRTIDALHVAINGARSISTVPGQSTQVTATITPAVTGSVTFEVQYFDPLAGWQFRGYDAEPLENGTATLPFTPSVPGHWRVTATFAGTRTAAPASAGWATLFDVPPAAD